MTIELRLELVTFEQNHFDPNLIYNLQGNSNCERIVFEGNEIGQTAAVYFGDVFLRNNYITEIVGFHFYFILFKE